LSWQIFSKFSNPSSLEMQGEYFSNQPYPLYSYPQALNQQPNFIGVQPQPYQFQSLGPISQGNFYAAPYQINSTNSTDESIHLIKRKLNGMFFLKDFFIETLSE
jgi:hypothetical protein